MKVFSICAKKDYNNFRPILNFIHYLYIIPFDAPFHCLEPLW